MTKPINHSRLFALLGKHCCKDAEGGCRALAAEDDEATRQMMVSLLSHEGWRVSSPITSGSVTHGGRFR